jgi:hypothetical protein
MHNYDSENENSATKQSIMTDALVFKRVHTRWLLRFKNVPQVLNATKLTKYQTLGAWIGLCIDFIHENADCRISFTTPTGSLDANQVTYQQQFAKLSDDDLHLLFDLPSRLEDTQIAATVDIMVDCMGRDHDNVFIFDSQGWFGSEQGMRQSRRMERGVQGLSKTLNFFKKGAAQHEIQPVGSVLSL